MHNPNDDADRVDTVFYYSPPPTLDTLEKPSKPKPEAEEIKPKKKATPLTMQKLKTLLKKYFDECDVSLNRFREEKNIQI